MTNSEKDSLLVKNAPTLTYNPLIGLYLVSKSETWTIKIFGKNAFDFAIFKIIYRGIFKKN